MEQLNKHIGELQSIDRERYSQMRPYSVVVYIAFGVFLFTDVMLIRSFFAQIISPADAGSEHRKVAQQPSSAAFHRVDVGFLKTVMFHAVIVQAIIGGLVAGKMGEARLGAGLKHVLILLVIGFRDLLHICMEGVM